jgi:hypothetical protein
MTRLDLAGGEELARSFKPCLMIKTGHCVGGAFMPASPIYRPGVRIDGPLADNEV